MGQNVSSTLVEDRYFLQKIVLGEGAFGTVWRAVDRQSGEMVAVKQLDKAFLRKKRFGRNDVGREIKLMKAWRHDNIAGLYDTFEDEKTLSLVLEYCDGGDFSDKIKERGINLSESDAADWVTQMTEAVAALHSKCICHRDIKPENFMVKLINLPNGKTGGFKIKLSDFGLATFLPPDHLLTDACGTPAFMAPEIYYLSSKRSLGYNSAVDVWALGVSMNVVMCGGRHPFVGDKGDIDKKLLLEGTLDFREDGMKGLVGSALNQMGVGLRYSDEARQLCKCMVWPDPIQRLTAVDARGGAVAWRSNVYVPPSNKRAGSARRRVGGA